MRNTINESSIIIADFKEYYGLVSDDDSIEQLLKSFIDKILLAKIGIRDIKNYESYKKIISGLLEKRRGNCIGDYVRFSYQPYSQRYVEYFDELVKNGVIIYQKDDDIIIMNYNEITSDFEFGSYQQGFFGLYGRGYDMQVEF